MARTQSDSGTRRAAWVLGIIGALAGLRGMAEADTGVALAGAVLVTIALGLSLASKKNKRSAPAPGPGSRSTVGSQWRTLPNTDLRPTWPAPHEDFTGAFSSIHEGRSHRRRVVLFTTPGARRPRTWLAISLHGRPEDVSATSNGRNEVRVHGHATPELQDFLKQWGASRMVSMAIRSGTLFVEVPVSNAQIPEFLQRRVQGLVQIVDATIDSEQARRAAASRPASPPASPTPASPTPAAPAPTPAAALVPEPIEQHERPALQPAAPDPVAAEIADRMPTTTWAPSEWTPPRIELTPVTLTAPGEADGWKPREWTPPTYEFALQSGDDQSGDDR